MLSLVFMFKKSPVLLNFIFSYVFGNANREMNSFWNQMPVISLTWLNFCLFMSGLDVLLVFLFMRSHYFTHIALKVSLGLRKGVCVVAELYECVPKGTAWYLHLNKNFHFYCKIHFASLNTWDISVISWGRLQSS